MATIKQETAKKDSCYNCVWASKHPNSDNFVICKIDPPLLNQGYPVKASSHYCDGHIAIDCEGWIGEERRKTKRLNIDFRNQGGFAPKDTFQL